MASMRSVSDFGNWMTGANESSTLGEPKTRHDLGH